MKKYLYTLCTVALLGLVTSCVDSFDTTNRNPDKLYLDDIDIEEFKEIPTYKRMCICILRNDHTCKYMGFALNKEENEMKNKAMQKYSHIL